MAMVAFMVFSSYVFLRNLLLFLRMHVLRRLTATGLLLASLGSTVVLYAVPVAAQSPKTLLPENTNIDCRQKMMETQRAGFLGLDDAGRSEVLSCGIKTGRIPLWLVPFYVVRAIDFLLLLSGVLAVLFIVIGAYRWIIGSYADDKESGKKTVFYAIGGLVLSLLSYTIVQVVLFLVTS